MKIHSLDAAVIVLYLIVVSAVGIIMKNKANKSKNDYMLGGNNLPFWMLHHQKPRLPDPDPAILSVSIPRSNHGDPRWIQPQAECILLRKQDRLPPTPHVPGSIAW